jgi:hypothetical protein
MQAQIQPCLKSVSGHEATSAEAIASVRFLPISSRNPYWLTINAD